MMRAGGFLCVWIFAKSRDVYTVHFCPLVRCTLVHCRRGNVPTSIFNPASLYKGVRLVNFTLARPAKKKIGTLYIAMYRFGRGNVPSVQKEFSPLSIDFVAARHVLLVATRKTWHIVHCLLGTRLVHCGASTPKVRTLVHFLGPLKGGWGGFH